MPIRTSGVREEVRRQCQWFDNSHEHQESLTPTRYNTLSSLTSPISQPNNKSLSLFFFRKRRSHAVLHGSPMVIQLCKSDRIEDWQEYLQAQAQDHPAWRSFAHIRTKEFDPPKPICVEYWEGGNSLSNINEAIGSGTISNLLKLVDNPKDNNILSQHSRIKARRPNESIRIGYTVHIRNIDYESEEDTSIDFSSLLPSRQKEQPSRHQRSSKEVPKSQDSDI